MAFLSQGFFALTLILSGFLIGKRVAFIRSNIRLGKKVTINPGTGLRLKNLLLVAFGQKKMFKYPFPAFLHFFVYVGFLIINLEVLEFILDGLAGTHRIFLPLLGRWYNLLINSFEGLALLVTLSCIVFLVRRNVLKVERFWLAEMTAWPRLDANLILIIEIFLMGAILTMNATDQLLQKHEVVHYPQTGHLFISSFLIPIFQQIPPLQLVWVERVAWWIHIVGILGFAIYVTYSKHLHIFLAFPNTYFANLEVKGYMENMPVVTNEVKSMLGLDQGGIESGEPGRFGVKDIQDLSWIQLMGAYTCTECGRCTSDCPANMTGKKLSPRKIMMDVRDRMEEVGKSLAMGEKGLEDGKTLLHDYITKEEIFACTSCQACVEACPVLINPMAIILELRRYVAMEESGTPSAWNAMFQNMETSFAPWKFSPSDRFNWASEK